MIKLFSIKWFKFLPVKTISAIKLVLFFFTETKKIRESEVVFFFPFYHTGGAEKVHSDIVNCFTNNNTYIFFEGKSNSNNNKNNFIQNSSYYEVFDFLNRNRFIRKIFLIHLSKVINKSKNIITLFASNCSFFYLLLPNINDNINKIDLTHAFSYPDKGGEVSSLPFVSYLTNRIVINKRTSLDFKKLYNKNNLDSYFKRIMIIQNGVSIKNNNLPLKENEITKICFVGRWSKEKRPELFLEISRRIVKEDSTFKFYFIGTDDKKNQKKIKKNKVINLGEIKNSKDLEKLYKEYHFILITSYREGFPMVLMEAMNFGVVPICSNVGGISEHIIDMENGFLINNDIDEEIIISDFIDVIKSRKTKMNYYKLSKKTFLYAKENFGIEKFEDSYRKLFLSRKK